jgi:hypothetical protein
MLHLVRWPPLLTVLPLACGGTTTGARGSDAGADASAVTDAGGDAGTDGGSDSGCLQPPAEPVYDCDAATPDAGSCGPWGSTASSPSYPVGCVVTTTQEGTYCGPVTCNCGPGFEDGGVTWTCAL